MELFSNGLVLPMANPEGDSDKDPAEGKEVPRDWGFELQAPINATANTEQH
jgi:hypothetical protein